MGDKHQFWGFVVTGWFFIPVILVIWTSTFFVLKKVLIRTIKKFARRTQTPFDDVFVQAIDFPLTIIIFTSGFAIVERFFPSLINVKSEYLLFLFKASIVIAGSIFAERLINGLINQYVNKVEILKASSGIARVFVRLVVFSLGLLILLDSFGVSVTPIIASLGIGSLAVALAIQPTLENLFSGIQIVVDRPFEIGNFIRLETGEEGFVDKILWRCTWLRLGNNNVIVIPNKSLVNAKVTNFNYPSPQMNISVPLGVHYNSNLEHVEEVTLDVAKDVLKSVSGGVKDFEPRLRYQAFADSSINFSVVMSIARVEDEGLIKHEFFKRLHKRYAKEGIVIPYPVRAINYDQEKVSQDALHKERKG